MQLTKLEINGFKSFAKKTELVFEQGITGILGPNGCGKSNIADAFRFVLGEQSARALRGKKVEDFIFGGTEKRKPLSYCEVSMYFDNSDGSLASPYTEVCVTRRAFRSGESEYYINKTACRLRDIQELFHDTGIGKDGYSIIGQGRVGEILSDRSNERRIVFEEAAGVMRYRIRKEEAERKLQNTAKNLVRLEDILSELESRLEPLREQSEKAAKYFEMREELRSLDLTLFVRQYDRSTERIRQLTETAEQLGSELISATAEEENYAAVCAAEESAERRLSESISETSRNLIALSTTLESGVGSEKLLRERISALLRSVEQSEAELAELERRSEQCRGDIAVLEGSVTDYFGDTEALEASLKEAQEQLASLEKEIEAKEAELEQRKQAMMDALNRLADTKSLVSRLGAMREAMVRRLDGLASERAAAVAEGEKLADELREIGEEAARLEAQRDALSREIFGFKTKIAGIEHRIAENSQELRRLEDQVNAIDSRRKVLEEMKRAHEGYYASVRRLLNDAERDSGLKQRIHGVVAELISVPAEYEKAIEMALGSALQNIIVPTEQDAKAVIEYLRRRDYGRATLLPVSAMRPRLLTNEERSYIKVDGCFGVASDLVSFSPAFRGVMENLLGRTVIVRDIDTGILINKKARSAFRIATLDGDILNPGGSMTGGSVQKREFSLLGREREIEELGTRRAAVIKNAESIRKAINSAREELEQTANAAQSRTDSMQQLAVALASNKEKADITSKYVKKNLDGVAELDEEAAKLNDSISDIDNESSRAATDESAINEANAVTGEDIRTGQQELAALRAKLQQANDDTASIRVRLMAAVKEKNAATAEIARLNQQLEQFAARTAELKAEIETSRSSVSELENELSGVNRDVGADRERVNALTDELHAMEAERAEHLKLLDESRERREQILLQISELKERLHRGELTMSKLKSDLENMADRIWQDYELTYENALPYCIEMPATQMHMRSDELRREIRALGEVNTSAIEDYRSVKERYDDLSAQCADLKKAEEDLTELISQLTSTMEREFSERFREIQQNFSRTFRSLFGGGRAELVLADKNDVLNSNIDIIAQPPGKKLQLLSLLSGGEQALTAIALLFAILELKPAAFCILDEIDTSLDEANVDCFAEYLRGYANGTQFIIITHRKGSMAVCNALYGVSMEEKGVSTIVSAKFE